MIDLHIHSTFSDGSCTPGEIVDLGVEAGLSALALTDHDSTGGLNRFLAACAERKIIGVPGVEISADMEKGTMHMLGYLVDHTQPSLERVLEEIRDGRNIRNRKILHKFNEMGLTMTWEEIAAYAGEDVVGRPHFAQALIARGYVKSKQEVFDRYLAKGKSAYVDRFRLTPEVCISTILEAGGIPVLSHPFTLELNAPALRKQVETWAEVGLQGIEVYYPEHSSRQVREYLALVKDFGLIATGGSDFHGAMNPSISLGRGFGDLRVADELLDKLLARKAILHG